MVELVTGTLHDETRYGMTCYLTFIVLQLFLIVILSVIIHK
jgi:hypothetical protein